MSKKSKSKKSLRENQDDSIPDDPRFNDLLNAPIFKNISKEKHKVEIDDRFKAALTDERFNVISSSSVDAYGRKIKKGAGKEKILDELYKVEEDREEEADEKETSIDKQRKTKALSTPKKSKLDLADRVDYLNKLARGEISCSDDSDSTDDDDSQQEVEDDNENEEEAIDEEEVSEEDSDDDMEIDEEEQLAIALLKGKSPLDIPTATLQGEEGEEEQDETEEIELGEATRRLSILNCDWDNIRAEDIM
jgi:hypothetical protein